MLRMFLLSGIFLLMCHVVSSQNNREFEMTEGGTTYTMKQYIFCLLKSGPNRGQEKEEAARIQAGHLAHIDSLAKIGLIDMAGPFGDDGEFRGILVFDVATVQEAEQLESKDPAVMAGRLVMEFHPWWTMKGGCVD